MKNSADLGGCYPPRPSASVDNILLDLQNSSYPTQPQSIIANYISSNVHLQRIKRMFQGCCETALLSLYQPQIVGYLINNKLILLKKEKIFKQIEPCYSPTSI